MNAPLRAACLLIFIPSFLTSCGPDAGASAARAEITGLKQRLQVMQDDMDRAANEAKAAQRTLEEARNSLSGKEKEFKAGQEALQKKLDEATKAFEEYKAKYKVSFRSRAIGTKIASLDGGTGQVFKDVEIVALSPGELKFHHASGMATVHLGSLSPELRDQFQYNADEANAWLAEEQRKQDAKEEEAARAEIAAYQAASKTKGPGSRTHILNAATRKRYQKALEDVYTSARVLQSQKGGCPVHKRYQLASFASQAAKLKKLISSLPSS